MFPFLAWFYNKITNSMRQGLEGGGHMCALTFLVMKLSLEMINSLLRIKDGRCPFKIFSIVKESS
jgi:hypothetical protein